MNVRDWLYAHVTSECIEFLLHNGKNGESYNVAANHKPEITNKTAAEWICRILGVDPGEWIKFIPDPRPNHDFRYALNTNKLKSIGFTPRVDPFNQFSQTVSWYRENINWWQKRKQEAESIYK